MSGSVLPSGDPHWITKFHQHASNINVSNINELLIKLESMTKAEFRDTIIKSIHKGYDDIDGFNKIHRNILAEKKHLLERTHVLDAEINSLKNKLARIAMCDQCKKC